MDEKSTEAKRTLSTNGLTMSSSFPVEHYESIHKNIVEFYGKHEFYEHYAGSWNALAYRYQAAIEYGDEFVESLKTFGTTPSPLNRFTQERLLFDFYSSSFSSFEAMYYGLFSIGHFVSPEHFPISSPRDQQRISLGSTRKAYLGAFPTDQIISSFDTIASDSQYKKVREVRNVLSHRTAPGRRIFVGLGTEDAPTTEWKLNDTPLDQNLILECTESLSHNIGNMLLDTVAFIERNIKFK